MLALVLVVARRMGVDAGEVGMLSKTPSFRRTASHASKVTCLSSAFSHHPCFQQKTTRLEWLVENTWKGVNHEILRSPWVPWEGFQERLLISMWNYALTWFDGVFFTGELDKTKQGICAQSVGDCVVPGDRRWSQLDLPLLPQTAVRVENGGTDPVQRDYEAHRRWMER